MAFTSRPHRRLPTREDASDTPTQCPPRALTSWWWVWVLTTLVALTHGPACAEWVALEQAYQSPGLQTVYVDAAGARKEGNLVTIDLLVDWKMMQGMRSPTRFYSTRTTKQFNCADKLVRTLASIDFYGRMGTGRVIGGSPFSNETYWVPVVPESLNQGLWSVACGRS